MKTIEYRQANGRGLVLWPVLALTVGCAFFCGAGNAEATSKFWTGGDGEPYWNWNNNWYPTGGASGGDLLNFGDNAKLINTNSSVTWLTEIWFKKGNSGSTSPSFTLRGNAVALNKIEVNDNPSAQTVEIGITARSEASALELNPVTGNLTLAGNVNNNGKNILVYGGDNKSLTLSGVVSGTGELQVRPGAANYPFVKINGPSTYSGTSKIICGELWVGEDATIYGASAGAVVVGDASYPGAVAKFFISDMNGSTTVNETFTVRTGGSANRVIGGINTSGVNTFSGAVTLEGDVALYTASGGTSDFTANIGGGYAVYKTGSGTVVFSGSKGYTGSTYVEGGALTVGTGGSLGSGSDVYVSSGAAVAINNSCTVASMRERGTSNGGTASIANGQTLTVNMGNNKGEFFMNSMSGGGGLTISGSGSSRMSLYGTQTYTGDTTVNSGILGLQDGAVLSTANLILNAGASLNIDRRTSALAFGAQTLKGPNATGTGTIVAGSDDGLTLGATSTLHLPYFVTGTAPLAVTGGPLKLNAATTVAVYNNGTALAVGDHKIVSASSAGSVALISTAPAVTVTGNGIAGGCAALVITSGELYVRVYAASVGGTATPAASPVCAGSSTTITLSGSTGTIQWYSSTDGNTYTILSGETSATLVTGNLTAKTYYRATVTSSPCAPADSSVATVDVSPASVGGSTAAAPATIDEGSTSEITLSSQTGSIVKWQYSADNFASDVHDIGSTANPYTTAALSANTYFRAVVQSGACSPANSGPTLVSVTPMLAINTNQVNVREAGEGRFFVRLNQAPVANVVVGVARSAGSSSLAVTGGAALTFTPANWSTWQMVTLAQADDGAGNTANETATFEVSATGWASQFVAATALDDDGLGDNLALASMGATMTRGGVPITSLRATDGIHNSSANYVFTKWTSVPPEEMTLDLKFTSTVSRVRLLNWNWDTRIHRYTIEASADGSSWSTLVDASAEDHQGWDDWAGANSIRYLRFTGLYNSAPGGNAVCISEWEVYGTRILAPSPLPVANTATVNVRENGEGRFFVKLASVPVGSVNVTVAAATGGDTDLTVTGGSTLTFTPLNWNTWQAVTLAAASDADTANGTATINLTAPDVAVVTVTAQELDDDIGENLALASSGSSIAGGANRALTIDGRHADSANYGYTVWTTDPKGTMTLDLNRVATVTRIRLLNWDWAYRVHRYTIQVSTDGSNWSTPVDASGSDRQGWDDWPVEASVRYLRFTGLSSSAGGAVCIAEWEVYSATDLLPAPVVSRSAVNARENGEGRFYVKLAQKPTASTVVTVAPASGGDASLTVTSGGTLTFTSANWSTWQLVTLAAVDDEDAVNGTATINVSYPGSAGAEVVATELDDDGLGDNLALTSAGSTITGSYALRAIDGIHNSSVNYGYATWGTGAKPMVLDLKAAVTVSRIRLLNWDWGYRLHRYTLEYSLNGTDWTPLATSGAAAQRGWDDIAVEEVSLQYLRFTGLENSVNAAVCVAELEVYGPPPGPQSLPKASLKVALEPEPVLVLTSDGPEDETGWNAVDGDAGTAWVGQKAGGGYLVIEYRPTLKLSVLEAELAEGSLTKIDYFYSLDAEVWQPLPEDMEVNPVSLNYLWLAFPDDGRGAVPRVVDIWPNP